MGSEVDRNGRLNATSRTTDVTGNGRDQMDLEAASAAGTDLRQSVAIVDNFAFSRECIAGALQAAYPTFSIHSFENVDEFLRKTNGLANIELMLLNTYGLGVTDPEVALALSALRQNRAGLAVMLVGDFDSADSVRAALRQGVRGCIPRNATLDIVVPAMRLVKAGGTFIPASSYGRSPNISVRNGPNPSPTIEPLKDSRFTPTQIKVLCRIAEGKANKIIAHELAISVSTVKVHVRHIMQKLKASNRTEVAFRTRGMSLYGG